MMMDDDNNMNRISVALYILSPAGWLKKLKSLCIGGILESWTDIDEHTSIKNGVR
jgi:hypothetical protein